MKKLLTILLIISFGTVVSQNIEETETNDIKDDYQLEKLRELSKKIFVIAAMDDEKVFSVKFESKDTSGTKFWIKTSYQYKVTKDKKGKITETKNSNYSMSLVKIDCINKEYEFLKIINYDGNDKMVSSLDGNGKIEYVVPNSNMERFSSIICN